MSTDTTTVCLPEAAYGIARRLHEGLAADRVYLFGSHARGEGTSDSDLDFLVVVAEWEKELNAPCSLSSTVLREGIALDGKP